MQVNLPPIIPYLIGLALIAFGGLRIKFLGAPRSRRERDADLQEPLASPSDDIIERGPEQKRHIRWGVIWILLGVFLVVSTYLQARRR
jgi:hypothetical protein